jgi:glycosyltransferase 2 family protein
VSGAPASDKPHRARTILVNLAKIAVAGGLMWWVLSSVGVDKVSASLKNIHFGTWVLGFLAIFIGTCISIARWYVLMRSVGLDTTLWTVFRLGWIGVFFNNIVPGLTGGDLVKAIYVTREHPNQRADAVISVIVDRIIGIVALALIAAVVIPFDFDRYSEAALGIYGFLGVAAVGAVLVLSRRVKAKLKALLGRGGPGGRGSPDGAPGLLGKVDRAISIYRERLGTIAIAMLMSFAVHLLLIVGIWLFGDALAHGNAPALDLSPAQATARQLELDTLGSLGIDVYCSTVPIIMIIQSLPIAPAGIGVGETAFQYFFDKVGVANVDAVALSLTYRFTAMFTSLLGGIFLILDRKKHPKPAPARAGDPAG